MLSHTLLKEVILDQAKIKLPEHTVPREIFHKVEEFRKNPSIIIITGLRRCGKSTLLQMIRHKTAERDFFINFDDDRLSTFQLSDFQKLLECFIELYGEQKHIYLDEVQNIPEWERFARRLHDQGYKIYITGSNALMLSKELGTRLTGRYLPVEMYPFSFKEWVHYSEPSLLKPGYSTAHKASLKRLFEKYIEMGGLPEYLRYPHSDYLHTLYENILYKDIIARYRITQEQAIKQLGYYLASNIAKDTNFRQLGALIQASSSSVSDYCHYLENCYLNFMISRYSHSLKKQYGYQKKSYFIDTALAKSIGFRISEDGGRALENIVFLALKRDLESSKEIYFHQEKKGCDFIIKQGNRIIQAIQVALHLHAADTREREVAGLVEALQHYRLSEGLLLTHDEEQEWIEERDGKKFTILVKPVWRWLLER